MSETFIELRHVLFSYSGAAKPVLRGVSLTLDPDARLGLIGPNGSGKTTLFHLVMGLKRPSQGQVLYQEQVLEGDKDFQELRKNVGLVFQNCDDQLFSPTVLEDVAFGPLNTGMTPAQAKEIANQTLRDLGLEGFGERITHKLSGGEKRLVSLATVLAMRPKLLLLDEPTNDLDPDTRERLIEILRNLETGLFIISHDWDFLSQIVEKVLAMKDGHLHSHDLSILHTHQHVHAHGDLPHEHRG